MQNVVRNITGKGILADTHCHLHSDVFKDKLSKVFSKAIEAGLKEIWLVSVDQKSAKRNVNIIRDYQPKYPEIKLRLGVGLVMELLIPGSDLYDKKLLDMSEQNLREWIIEELDEIRDYVAANGLGIELLGEVGLDYYWLEKNKISAEIIGKSKQYQKILLEAQLDFATEHNLPISLHSRGAEEDCIKIIGKYRQRGFKPSMIFHSFTGTEEQLEKIIELRCLVGVNGIITYRSAKDLLKAIRQIYTNNPQSIVFESDAPYLIPSNASRNELSSIYGREINHPASVSQIQNFL